MKEINEKDLKKWAKRLANITDHDPDLFEWELEDIFEEIGIKIIYSKE